MKDYVPFTPAAFEQLVAASRGEVERIRDLVGGLEPLHSVFSNDEIVAFGLQDRLSEFGVVPAEGQTSLHLAAQGGHFEAAQTLLELGANPDGVIAARSTPPLTPLALAAGRQDERMVRLLLDWGARVLVSVQGDWRRHPPEARIIDARGRSQIDSIETLLKGALEWQRAEGAMRDALARKDTEVPAELSPACAEAYRIWNEAAQHWREATRNETRPTPEILSQVEKAAWLHSDSRASAPAASVWALDALARGELSRSEWILRRYLLDHPIKWSGGEDLGFFLSHCRAFVGGTDIWERIKARRAAEDVVMDSRYRHHPTAIAFAKLHEFYRNLNRRAAAARVLLLGAAAAVAVLISRQIRNRIVAVRH